MASLLIIAWMSIVPVALSSHTYATGIFVQYHYPYQNVSA